MGSHIHPIHHEGEWQNSATLPHDGWDGYGRKKAWQVQNSKMGQ